MELKKSAEIVGTKRIEKYEYPEKAIREIVANAIIHKDYKITETYTQVNIFEDRIKIWEYLIENKTVTAKKCENLFKDISRKTINYDFKKMQEMGLLHSVGESRSTYYEPNF